MRTHTICLALAIVLICPCASAQWVRTTLDSPQVSCLAVRGSSLFAGRGGWQRENGVFRSLDSGATWSLVAGSEIVGVYGVNDLAVSGTNIFAAGVGIYHSTDNGPSWHTADSGLPHSNFRNVAVAGTRLFIGSDHGVFVSTDTGTSWLSASSGLPPNLIGCRVGAIGGNLVAGVQVYDTNSGTWTQSADMLTGRWGHSAVVLNGLIYVFGGASALGGWNVYSSEVYNPQTNTWTAISNMPTARYCLIACSLEGSIYTIGGWKQSSHGPVYDNVEVYNPDQDMWFTETPMPVARAVLASTVVDGKIYVYGGARTTHPNIGTSGIYEFERAAGRAMDSTGHHVMLHRLMCLVCEK